MARPVCHGEQWGFLVVLPGGPLTSTTVLTGGEIVSTGVVLVQPNSQVTLFGPVASDLVVGRGATDYVLLGGRPVSPQ